MCISIDIWIYLCFTSLNNFIKFWKWRMFKSFKNITYYCCNQCGHVLFIEHLNFNIKSFRQLYIAVLLCGNAIRKTIFIGPIFYFTRQFGPVFTLKASLSCIKLFLQFRKCPSSVFQRHIVHDCGKSVRIGVF